MANVSTVVLIFTLLLSTRELMADGGTGQGHVLCAIYNTLLLGMDRQLRINNFSDTDLDDAAHCTHLLFMSRPIQFTTLDMMNDNSSETEEVDPRAAYFRRGEDLKRQRPELKLILNTGVTSWAIETEQRRQKLFRYVVSLLKRNKLDGLMFHCEPIGGDDAEACVQFYKNLSVELGRHNLTLFVFLPGEKTTKFDARQHRVIERYSELVLIETNNTPKTNDRFTSIMYPLVKENSTIDWYLGQGIPAHKMVVLFPLFAETYKLRNSNDSGLGAETIGPGLHSRVFSPGQLPSPEMMKRLKNPEEGWVVRRDPESNSPYAVNADGIWVTYEDLSSIRSKVQYLKSVGICGVMIFTFELDDYRGDEGLGRFPMIRAVHEALRSNQ